MQNVVRQRETFALHGEAINGRQIAISLPNEQNGVVLNWGNAEYWNVRGASLRGNWRHACSEQVFHRLGHVHPGHTITTATARLLSLGGVKSSGTSKIMTPSQIERAQAMNPLIDMLGCSDPGFFAGHLYVAHMRSEDPIDRDRNNQRAYHLQVVRRPLAHGPFKAADLSDPEKIEEFAGINRYRSQLEGFAKLASTLEGRLSRKPDAKLQKQLDTVFAEVQKLTDQKFTNAADLQAYRTSELASIQASGHSTVSEQTIPIGQEVIPSGTRMKHSVHIVGAGRFACGLLVDGISARTFRRPFIGGRAASGCGGYITTIYQVKRLINDAWVDDCTIELVPEHRVTFHNADHSQLKACYEEWLACNIDDFDFTYEGLRQIASGNGNGDADTAEC